MLLRVSIDIFIIPQNYGTEVKKATSPSISLVFPRVETRVSALKKLPVTVSTKRYREIYHTSNVIEFEVSSSWDDISSSASVKIPRKQKKVNVIRTQSDVLEGKIEDKDFFVTDIMGSLYDYINIDKEDRKKKTFTENFNQAIKDKNNKKNLIFKDLYSIKIDDNNKEKKELIIKRGDIIFIVPRYFGNGLRDKGSTTYNSKIYNQTMLESIKYQTNEKDIFSSISSFSDANNIYADVEKNKRIPRSQIFVGYITEVGAEYDITLKCQDFMYWFQTQLVSNDVLESKKLTVEQMAQRIIDDATKYHTNNEKTNRLNPIFIADSDLNKPKVNFVRRDEITKKNSTIGDLIPENATAGMIFQEMKDHWGMKPFFYPNSCELNILPFKYNDNEFSSNHLYGYQFSSFVFGGDITGIEGNIISSNLEYKKKESILVGAYIKSIFKVPVGTGNQASDVKSTATNGKKRQKTEPLQVFVGQSGGVINTYFYDRNDIVIPKTDPERAIIKQKMVKRGEEMLAENVYEGYYGSFTVFGYPYIRHGDHVAITDPKYPDRQGIYLVKSVRYYGGTDVGLRQEITLHIKWGPWPFNIKKQPAW